MSLKDILNQLAQDPERVELIPQALTELAALEQTLQDTQSAEQNAQMRITKLQESNRDLLNQIPMPGAEPPAAEPEFTEETATTYLVGLLNGGRD